MTTSTNTCAQNFNAQEVYLMNVSTGSVDTKENWECESDTQDLIEVTLVDGNWIEK